MDLMQSINVSASGLNAQSTRMKVISENIANAQAVSGGPNGGPYRRQQLFFQTITDNTTGLAYVKVADVKPDTKTPLKQVYDPTHPLADEQGFVAMPNVNTFTESTDMRDAVRAYEANLSAIEASKEMMVRSMDILR